MRYYPFAVASVLAALLPSCAWADSVLLMKYPGDEFRFSAKILNPGGSTARFETFEFRYLPGSGKRAAKLKEYLGDKRIELGKDDVQLELNHSLLRADGGRYIVVLPKDMLALDGTTLRAIWLVPKSGEVIFDMKSASGYWEERRRGNLMNAQAFEGKALRADLTYYEHSDASDLPAHVSEDWVYLVRAAVVADRGVVFDTVDQINLYVRFSNGRPIPVRITIDRIGFSSLELASAHEFNKDGAPSYSTIVAPDGATQLVMTLNYGKKFLFRNSADGIELSFDGKRASEVTVSPDRRIR